MITPQECPECKVSLADPDVPADFQGDRTLFTLALSNAEIWQCPVCGHQWPKHGVSRKLRRARGRR